MYNVQSTNTTLCGLCILIHFFSIKWIKIVLLSLLISPVIHFDKEASSVFQECPSGPNVILITAVLSASVVVLLGVVLLLLWKLLTSIHDRREFAHFQRELEQRRWNRVSPARTNLFCRCLCVCQESVP